MRLAHRRLLAYLCDGVDEPLLAVSTGTWLAAHGRAGLLLTVAWVGWIASELWHQATGGQTFGKRVCGLAVVDQTSGLPLGVPRTVTRWATHAVDTVLPWTWIRCLCGRHGRSIADHCVGSIVVDASA